MKVKTYDASQVSVIVGVTPIVGISRDGGIKITYEEEEYAKKKDLKGSVARSHLNNKTIEVELNLTQDSMSNNILSAYAQAARLATSQAFNIFIKDNNSETRFSSYQAWIEKCPDLNFVIELGVYTWKIIGEQADWFIGGIND